LTKIPISQITQLSGNDLLSTPNYNCIVLQVFNQDWFIHSSKGTIRVYEAMNPSDFDNIHFQGFIPVIHDNAFILTPSSIVLNPPPIFIPCPGIILLLWISVFFMRRR